MQDRFKFRFFEECFNKIIPCDDYDLNKIFNSGKIVMQCTGLKDKNGKLIYEGDIVRDINIPSYFYIVVWFKGGFYLKSTVSNSFLVFDTTQQEVIGNIYENPELLEVSNDY